MLNIHKQLEIHKSLDYIISRLALYKAIHPLYNNLVQLCYNQLDSPKINPVVKECRGLILDITNNYKVVSYPFDRFYDYREGHTNIDFSTANYYTKEDGSLITLYYYNDQWFTASKRLPTAEGSVDTYEGTLSKLFWEVWNDLGYVFPTNTNYCYMFELVSNYNSPIVKYETPSIKLTGVRNLTTLKEETIDDHKHNWQIPQSYSFKDIEEAFAFSYKLNPFNQEGYVVVDANFNRAKIKGLQYEAVQHLTNAEASTNKVLKVIQQGEGDEFVALFPEDKWVNLNNRYKDLIVILNKDIEQFNKIPNDLEFYHSIAHLPYKSVLISIRKSKYNTVPQALADMPIKNFKKLFNNA